MNWVTIIYKSGARVQIKCEDFKVNRYRNGSLEVEWNNAKPRPLLVGVDDISAIYDGRV